eukprot:705025_1
MEVPHNLEPGIKAETIAQQFSTSFRCGVCDEEFHLNDHLIQHVMASHQTSTSSVKSEVEFSAGAVFSARSQNDIVSQTNTSKQLPQRSAAPDIQDNLTRGQL